MKQQQLTHHEIVWETQKFPIIIACDNWTDPRNVGMAFRLADAFGVECLLLGGTTPTPPNRKIGKTARSTQGWVAHQYHEHLIEGLRDCRDEGYQLVGVEITDDSQPLRRFLEGNKKKGGQKIILVLGAESTGVSPEVLAVLDACIHIPMYGENSSLNVATALAIALHEVVEFIRP